MKHNLTMIAETPEPGVFVTVIKDGDEVIDTVKGNHVPGVAVCAYRPGHSKPLRPIYGLTPAHLKPDAKALEDKGYEVEIVPLLLSNCRGTIIYPDGKGTCGTECPLFYNCRHVGDPDSLAVKIAQLCSRKFREGYRKGYNRRKREEKQ